MLGLGCQCVFKKENEILTDRNQVLLKAENLTDCNQLRKMGIGKKANV